MLSGCIYSQQYNTLSSTYTVPVFSKMDLIGWLRYVWNKISFESTRKSFQHIDVVRINVFLQSKSFSDISLTFIDPSDSDKDIYDDQV